jgi:hypothetical protein
MALPMQVKFANELLNVAEENDSHKKSGLTLSWSSGRKK